MNIKKKEKIQTEMKNALKAGETLKLSVLKMLLSSINNEEIRLRKKNEGLTDEEVQKVIKSEAKKRKESVEAYQQAGKKEAAEKEKKELTILESYFLHS